MSFPLMPCVYANHNDPTVEFTHSASSSSNLTTYTYTSVALGTETADRKVVVAVHTDADGPTPIGAVVNGVTATLLVNRLGVGLFIADVPTGTSVTVTTTFDVTAARAAMGVWTLKKLSRPADVYTNVNSGIGLTATTSVTAREGDAVIAAVSHRNTTGLTWSGGTERYDIAAGNSNRMSGADTVATSDTTAQTFSITGTSSAAWSAVSASFK